MNIKQKLVSAVTQYDEKQSRKVHHNPYALAQYLERVDAICADIEAGTSPTDAIKAGFEGRLADCCLRSLGLGLTTEADAKTGPVYYKPVSNKLTA